MPDGVLRSINSTKVQLNVKLILAKHTKTLKAYGAMVQAICFAI